MNNDNSYYALKKHALEKKKNNCSLLILGSSAENSGINPAIFDSKGINLAFVGGTSLDVFKLLIVKYVPEMPKLKTVIIPISTFTLFATEDREEMKFRKILLNNFFDLYDEDFSNLWSRSILANLGFKRSIEILTNGSVNNVDEAGFDPLIGNNLNALTEEYGIKTVYRHIGKLDSNLNNPMYRSNISLLKQIIDYLSERNIKLILVTTPTHPSYYNNIPKNILNFIHSELEVITDKYNINYYDHLMDDRFIDTDFYNCDHLNVEGAEKFSKIFNEEVFMN